MVFCLGDYEVDEERFELRHSGRPLVVHPRALEVIFVLVRNAGRLITKDDLIAGPWKGTAVGDGALNQAIMLARRALGEATQSAGMAGGGASAIVTVRGRGFRFVGDVKPVGSTSGAPPTTTAKYLPTPDALAVRV